MLWLQLFVIAANYSWYERHRDVVHGMHSPLVTYCLTLKVFGCD